MLCYRRCAQAALDDVISWLRNGGEVAVSLLIILLVFVFWGLYCHYF